MDPVLEELGQEVRLESILEPRIDGLPLHLDGARNSSNIRSRVELVSCTLSNQNPASEKRLTTNNANYFKEEKTE